jgi:hypothetical protein
MKRSIVLLFAAAVVTVAAASSVAGPKDPLRGAAFEKLVGAQDLEFQDFLRTLLPEEAGFVVTGPIDPVFDVASDYATFFSLPRVICADADVCKTAARLFEEAHPAKIRGIEAVSWPKSPCYQGHCGHVLELEFGDRTGSILFLTFQQNRWLIWLRRALSVGDVDPDAMTQYSDWIIHYLCSLDGESDTGQTDPPSAADFGLTPEYDLYPPRPDYVIEGYQNYKDYLDEHADIETYFGDGILAFVPTDSLLDVLKRDAPPVAWPNKEAPLLQHEFKKFFERGGDPRVMRTLTAEVLETLTPGEYFYAVGLSGKIRFAYETPREEVERVESETGKKLPRANHAFLFPGEPVLTAGAFFVEHDPGARIVEVDTHSGHYFYSNVSGTIRDDISRRSDDYLLTIGHFFKALDREGIPYDHILISKM